MGNQTGAQHVYNKSSNTKRKCRPSVEQKTTKEKKERNKERNKLKATNKTKQPKPRIFRAMNWAVRWISADPLP